MLELPFLSHALEVFRRKPVGDTADRLVGYNAALFCAFASMIVIGKQLMGSTMTCWSPGQYTGQWSQYVLDFCFLQNTYVASDLRKNIGARSQYTRINYYQWVALYFMVQAILFHLPSFIWKYICRHSPFRLLHLVNGARTSRNRVRSVREEALEADAASVVEAIKAAFYRPRTLFGLRGGPAFRLTIQYFSVKILNLLVSGMLIYQVADFLDQHDFFWAVRGLWRITNSLPWKDSPNFPRVTMCDVSIREMGNVRNETIQCLLGMNYFNEKLFFVEWLWLALVTGTVAYNLFAFIWNVLMRQNRISRLYDWLTEPYRLNISKKEAALLSDIIGLDGFLTIYLVEQYSGGSSAADMACHLCQKLQKEMNQLSSVNRLRISPDLNSRKTCITVVKDYDSLSVNTESDVVSFHGDDGEEAQSRLPEK